MVHEIERSGAQLKDVELGLVDFPGEVERQAGAAVLAVRRVGGGVLASRGRGLRGSAADHRRRRRARPAVTHAALRRRPARSLRHPGAGRARTRCRSCASVATSVRTTVGALGTLLAAYAPGVSAEAFWHALAGVSEEMDQRRLREHVEEPSRERFRRALARVGCDAEACREGGAALARAHHRALADVDRAPAGAPGAPRRAARAPPRGGGEQLRRHQRRVRDPAPPRRARPGRHGRGVGVARVAEAPSADGGERAPLARRARRTRRSWWATPSPRTSRRHMPPASTPHGSIARREAYRPAPCHRASSSGRFPSSVRRWPECSPPRTRYSRRGDGAPVTPRLRRLRSSGMALILSARSRSQ